MELQEETHPDLEIPLICHTLIAAVKDKDGIAAEGIFRISAGKDELTLIRRRFETGDYEVEFQNPFEPAALLKEWLRELAEPIIPAEHYTEAVSLARSEAGEQNVHGGGGRQGGASTSDLLGGEDEDSESSPGESRADDPQARLRKLYQAIPPLNRGVLTHMAALLKLITEKSAINKMTLSNLAIVLSPGLLRNPASDPLEILSNTKWEARFVTLLFEGMHNGQLR